MYVSDAIYPVKVTGDLAVLGHASGSPPGALQRRPLPFGHSQARDSQRNRDYEVIYNCIVYGGYAVGT
jgi:hypothetical protein